MPQQNKAQLRVGRAAVDVQMHHSEIDGELVLEIDTYDIMENASGPVMRVYLNDEPIYKNPGTGATWERLRAARGAR